MYFFSHIIYTVSKQIIDVVWEILACRIIVHVVLREVLFFFERKQSKGVYVGKLHYTIILVYQSIFLICWKNKRKSNEILAQRITDY